MHRGHPTERLKLCLFWRRLLSAWVLWMSGCVLTGCVTNSSYRELQAQAVQADPVPELAGVPFFPQEAYQCGPAALATVLNWAGLEVDPETLAGQMYIVERQGSLQVELHAATRRQGILPYARASDFSHLLAHLQAGVPVLVLQNLGLKWAPTWHYAVVVGYLPEAEQVLMRSGATRLQTMPLRDFARTWRYSDYWLMTVHAPGEIPIGAEPETYLRAAAGLERAGHLAAAQAAYLAATDQWPEQDLAWMGLGNARYQMEDFAGAESAYRQAFSLVPEHPAAAHNLAWALIRQKRLAEALPFARQAATHDDAQYQGALIRLQAES